MYPLIIKPTNPVLFWSDRFDGMEKVYKAKDKLEFERIIKLIYSTYYDDNLIIQEYTSPNSTRPTPNTRPTRPHTTVPGLSWRTPRPAAEYSRRHFNACMTLTPPIIPYRPGLLAAPGTWQLRPLNRFWLAGDGFFEFGSVSDTIEEVAEFDKNL